MTKDEALKLALEALKQIDEAMPFPVAKLAQASIKEALAQPKQEPVAVKHMMEWVDYLKRKSDYGQHMQIPSEMSAGACWELAIELEQFINTTPPQRTWVGLTAKEKHAIRYSHMTSAEFIECIEAKLKDKNTRG